MHRQGPRQWALSAFQECAAEAALERKLPRQDTLRLNVHLETTHRWRGVRNGDTERDP